ncbi:MAG TPA: transcriptional repressor [Terriglobia bacterium]|nr:transcriptional repressor [Terriglobia bacterium]
MMHPATPPPARRSTLQRQLVRRIVEDSRDHPTAQSVYERARQQIPSISLGTVYRNLQLLVEQGQLLERKIGNRPARYEARRQRHYHICCLRCGALEDLSVPYQEILDRRVQKLVRYKLQEHRMEFYGICPQCQSGARPRTKPAAMGRMRNSG